MFVPVPSKLALSDLLRLMKGRSTYKVKREFPHLKTILGLPLLGQGVTSSLEPVALTGSLFNHHGAITEDFVLHYVEKRIEHPTEVSR